MSTAPVRVGLAELPPDALPLPAEAWDMLLSILDAALPAYRRASAGAEADSHDYIALSDDEYNATITQLRDSVARLPPDAELEAYWGEQPSAVPEFQDALKRNFLHVRPDGKKGLTLIMSALGTTVGSLCLTGYLTPFNQQPARIRRQIYDGWKQASFGPMPIIAKQMGMMARSLWSKAHPRLYELCGFPAVPENYKPGREYAYNFLQFADGATPEVLDTDVVVVGSGCGGGVCAKILSAAGYKVLVVDKSYHFPASQLPMTDQESAAHMFERGGSDVSDEGTQFVVAASVWGGGGTINWAASLQTPAAVRKEWARERGLTFFETAEFQKSLDRVCEAMGVHTEHIRHNFGNQTLLEGSRKLGYAAKVIPQNTGNTEHYDGYCCNGCGSAEKQGPVNSWLPEAGRSGARFIEGFKVDEIVFSEKDGKKEATGVRGLWTSRDKNGGVIGPAGERTTRNLLIRAKKVILSCGSLWSPIVLLKSGLTNPQIGRNFYSHPVIPVIATFQHETKPWEGGIMTCVCFGLDDLDGRGHGVRLERMCGTPAMMMAFNPTTGLDFKADTLKYRHSECLIALVRDRDPGRIYLDAATGAPRISYSPGKFDRAHAMEGVLALCKIAYVQGAREIQPCLPGVAKFTRKDEPPTDFDEGVRNPAFDAWLEQVAACNTGSSSATFGSAHQMGTSRMSTSASTGVVDPRGKVWDAENLYVADASVFPSASGVNPMVTVMAIADWIARGVVKDLGGPKRDDMFSSAVHV